MFEKMHLMQYPTGNWGFVGQVHEKLANTTWKTEAAAVMAAKFAERFGSLPISQIIRNS